MSTDGVSTDAVSGEPSRLRADARRNRERILRTAMRHFSQHGIDASLDEIAREAEVGAGTLYRHFPSREALLAAALEERQAALLAGAQQAREISDAGAALGAWLASLQDYLRSFNGLPAPVLAAVKQQGSPLCLSCNALVALTGEFLDRAQQDGQARRTVTANELFLSALGLAWVLDRAEACGTTREALEKVMAQGYLTPERAEDVTHGGG
ncbi:helix-turn-helix transcriptional regulator [Ancylobacter sonchi]|uniref:TetR/AcrR family transcriptional regulator n=1 Tax=Ancylobacter sonchi TaxID=1937790 RepID=UPI001BD38258|nr:helix-turn-helix domain-containing protein [Ancylobacter sonchi]MBS7535961.1 helix-turn-helix transcriptional regulator [Ancylobacter sonchi]